jgi:hypothetical protein
MVGNADQDGAGTYDGSFHDIFPYHPIIFFDIIRSYFSIEGSIYFGG